MNPHLISCIFFFYYHFEDMSINSNYEVGKCLPRGTVINRLHLFNINEVAGTAHLGGGSFNEMQAKGAPVNMSLVEGNFWRSDKCEYLWCCPIPFSCNSTIDLEGVGAKLASSRLPWYLIYHLVITHGAAASHTMSVMVTVPQLVLSERDVAHSVVVMM